MTLGYPLVTLPTKRGRGVGIKRAISRSLQGTGNPVGSAVRTSPLIIHLPSHRVHRQQTIDRLALPN